MPWTIPPDIYKHTHDHVDRHIYPFTHLHTYVCTYTSMDTDKYPYISTYTSEIQTYMHITHLSMYTHIHTQVHIHKHIYTYDRSMHTYKHKCMYISICTCKT